jgi:hypothetical protein
MFIPLSLLFNRNLCYWPVNDGLVIASEHKLLRPIAKSCDHTDRGTYGYLNTDEIQLMTFRTLSIVLFLSKKQDEG